MLSRTGIAAPLQLLARLHSAAIVTTTTSAPAISSVETITVEQATQLVNDQTNHIQFQELL